MLEKPLNKATFLKRDFKNKNFSVSVLGAAFILASSLVTSTAEAQFLRGTVEQSYNNSISEVERRTVSIGQGENVNGALSRIGADSNDINDAVRALSRTISIKDVHRDDQLTVFMRNENGVKRLLGFNLASGADKSITVTRSLDGSYKARELSTTLQRRTLRVAGEIGEAGLVASVKEQGAPDRAAESIGDAFAFDVDFEREVGPGSSFELMYDRVSDTKGAVVREGEPIFARLTTLTGRTLSLYRFQAQGATQAEWFTSQGQSARRFLMRTPVNGAHLTSGFGYRRHPVLGYTKIHTGVDFGARIGTPTMAAGDGVVTRVGVMGGYGNVVDIEHGNGWSTRYAHLSRFASGLKPGDRVRQGDIIAFTGNTGRSTGPHLHYEVRRNGSPVNPMSANVPAGRTLTAESLAKFNVQVARIDNARREAMNGVNVAGNPTRTANATNIAN